MADTRPTKPKKAAQKPEKQASDAVLQQPKTQEAAPPEKKKTGRPSKYSPEIAQQMCEMLADGIPLREICRKEGFPGWRTVYDWMYRDDALGDEGVGLSAAIARAREIGQDAIAEDILIEIDQEPERILSEGGGRIDAGYVQLIKARADIKLKLLAKWNPKRYGDKVQVGGDPESPLTVDVGIFDTLLTTIESRRQAKAHG